MIHYSVTDTLRQGCREFERIYHLTFYDYTEIQKEFVLGKKLTSEKIETALARYSDEYFVDAMRDELTGFFSDDVVTKPPDILIKMGTRYFYLSEFENECSHYPEFEGIPCHILLDKLFVAGYIGQRRPVGI